MHQLWYHINHNDNRDSCVDLNNLGICVRISRCTVCYQFGLMRLITHIPHTGPFEVSLIFLSLRRETHLVTTAKSCWSCAEASKRNVRTTSGSVFTLQTTLWAFFPLMTSLFLPFPSSMAFTFHRLTTVPCFTVCVVIPIKPKSGDLLHMSLFLLLILH